MKQRIIRAVGGTISLVPPECKALGPLDAAPAPTLTIKTVAGADLAGSAVVAAAATVDSVSTTIATAGSAGDRSVALASVTGIVVGRRYLIGAANGEFVQVRVANIDTANKVAWLYNELPRAVAVADTFKGIELSYAVSAANATSPTSSLGSLLMDSVPRPTGPEAVKLYLYRAAWTYYIGGARIDTDTLYEVNARLLKSPLQPDELPPYLPYDIAHIQRDDTAQWTCLFDDAWLEVLDDLENRGYKPDRVMDVSQLRRPHLYKTLWLIGSTWGKPAVDWTKDQFRLYQDTLQAALNAGGWYDSTDDAIQQTGEVQFTSIRMSR